MKVKSLLVLYFLCFSYVVGEYFNLFGVVSMAGRRINCMQLAVMRTDAPRPAKKQRWLLMRRSKQKTFPSVIRR